MRVYKYYVNNEEIDTFIARTLDEAIEYQKQLQPNYKDKILIIEQPNY